MRLGRVPQPHHPPSLPLPCQQAAPQAPRRVQQGVEVRTGLVVVLLCQVLRRFLKNVFLLVSCSSALPVAAAGLQCWSWLTRVVGTTWGRCCWGSFAPSSTRCRSVCGFSIFCLSENKLCHCSFSDPGTNLVFCFTSRCLTYLS